MEDVSEAVTGFLFRQSRGRVFGIGHRWTRLKAVFVGSDLRFFTEGSASRQYDCLLLDDVEDVMPVLLVPRRAPVVPPGARAEAPEPRQWGLAQPPMSGFSLSLKSGGEVLLCTEDEHDRDRWLACLKSQLARARRARKTQLAPQVGSLWMEMNNPIVNMKTSVAPASQVPPTITCVEAEEEKHSLVGGSGKGKGKPMLPPPGKGKGKGKVNGKAPPPPPKGKGKSAKASTSQQANKASAKPKFYGIAEKRLQSTEVNNTVFFRSGAVDPVDFNAFVGGDASEDQRRLKLGTSGSKTFVQLFEAKTAQRLGVATARLDVSGLANVVDALDFQSGCATFRGGLEGAELLCDLLVELQSSAPLQALHCYLEKGGVPNELREIERRLVPLARVPRALQRMRLLIANATLEERIDVARRQIEGMLLAATAVQASPHLTDVVQAVQAFQNWNSGAEEAQPLRAFHVGEQLSRLNAIKPPGSSGKAKLISGYSLVHWTAETLLQWGRDLPPAPLTVDVPNLMQASKLSPTLLQEDLAWVRKSNREAREEFRNHKACYATTVLDREPAAVVAVEPLAVAIEQPNLDPVPPETLTGCEPPIEMEKTGGEGSDESTRPPSTTEFFSLDDDAESEARRIRGPTLFHKDQLGTSSSSGWDPGRMPSVHAQRLRVHAAGSFTYLVPCPIPALDAVQAPRLSISAATGRPSSVLQRQGFLWVLQTHRLRRPTWRKCWADIRSGHLVLRQLRRQRVRWESAIPLPGAEIVLFESLLASNLARWFSSLGVHGFQLIVSGDEAPLIVRVDSASIASTWHEVLSQDSDNTAGLGRLLMASGEKWENLWCILDLQEKIFCGYIDLVDHVFGRSPILQIDLRSSSVRESSRSSLKGARREFGFELEELQPGLQWSAPSRLVRFCVSSPDVLQKWLGVLQAAPRQIRWRQDGGASFGIERRSDFCSLSSGLASPRPSFGLAFAKDDDTTESTEANDPALESAGANEPALESAEANDLALESVRVDDNDAAEASLWPVVSPPSRRSIARQSIASAAVVAAATVGSIESRKTVYGGCEDSASNSSDSEISCEDASGDEAEDQQPAGPAANLRRLGRELRVGEKTLMDDVKAAQCAAQAALAFFDEISTVSGALDALHVFLGQLAGFSTEFKTALAGLRQHQAKLKAAAATAKAVAAKAGATAKSKARAKRMAGGSDSPTPLIQANTPDSEAKVLVDVDV